MNQILEVLQKRVTVRKYLDKQIKKEELDAILKTALSSANAMNRQSWYFTVVQNQDFLKDISDAVAAVMIDSKVPSLVERATNKDFSTFHHAPTVIFVSGDGSHYSNADCANASQNICNAAASLAIGSCYIGSFVQGFSHEKGKDLIARFNIPEGYKPTFAVALGYPKDVEVLQTKEREEKINYIL
jgi:nitroreductase